jgi:hypothetical protein
MSPGAEGRDIWTHTATLMTVLPHRILLLTIFVESVF